MAAISGVLVAMGAVAAGIVAMDHSGVFGTEWRREVILHEIRFRMLDDSTGGPIHGTRAKCMQHGNDNACTTRRSQQAGTLRINVPLHYRVRHSKWFVLERRWLPPEDPLLRVFFIHNDYLHQNRTLNLADLLKAEHRPEMTIRMQLRQ